MPLGPGFSTDVAPPWTARRYRRYDFWRGLSKNNWRQREENEFFHTDPGIAFTHLVLPVLDGKALVELASSDEVSSEGRWEGHRVRGCSIRYLDDRNGEWVMAESWPFPHDPTGFWEQLRGRFRHGRIELLSSRLDEKGEPFTLRYTFSDITDRSFRWDQARTWDLGTTWTVGSMAEFVKTSQDADWPHPSEPFPTFEDGALCQCGEASTFDTLDGVWVGSYSAATPKGPVAFEARLDARRILDGCGLLSVFQRRTDAGIYKLLEARGFNRERREWWTYQLDNQPGTTHGYQVARLRGGEIELESAAGFAVEDGLVPRDLLTDPCDPDLTLRKTVWQAIESDRITYELLERDTPGDDWEVSGTIDLTRDEEPPSRVDSSRRD